jgi:hypothetical protein
MLHGHPRVKKLAVFVMLGIKQVRRCVFHVFLPFRIAKDWRVVAATRQVDQKEAQQKISQKSSLA